MTQPTAPTLPSLPLTLSFCAAVVLTAMTGGSSDSWEENPNGAFVRFHLEENDAGTRVGLFVGWGLDVASFESLNVPLHDIHGIAQALHRGEALGQPPIVLLAGAFESPLLELKLCVQGGRTPGLLAGQVSVELAETVLDGTAKP